MISMPWLAQGDLIAMESEREYGILIVFFLFLGASSLLPGSHMCKVDDLKIQSLQKDAMDITNLMGSSNIKHRVSRQVTDGNNIFLACVLCFVILMTIQPPQPSTATFFSSGGKCMKVRRGRVQDSINV